MRLLEILILLSNIILLFSMFVCKRLDMKILLIGNFASLLFLILHFVAEGFRWQLLLSYTMVIVFFAVSLFRYIKGKNGNNHKRKVLRVIVVSLTVVLIIFSAGLSVSLPVYKLPKPTGSYSVGTQTFCFEDRDRDEIFTEDKSDKRKLMVQFWYPTKNTDGNEPAEYIPGGSSALNGLSNEYGIPEILGDYLKYVRSNSYKNAEIFSADTPYPLIIISHGLGTSRFLHTTQAENLASNGYIVAAIDHTYSTAITVFLDGATTYDKTDYKDDNFNRNTVGRVWSEDISFVLDQCEQINAGIIKSSFVEKIDMDNIGVFGHSFGGAAAFDSFNYDGRIKAGIDMDGSLFNPDRYLIDGIEKDGKSFMFMLSDQQTDIRELYNEPTASELESMELTREEYEKAAKDFLLENDIIMQTTNNEGYWISIADTAHYNFTDLPLFSPLVHLMGLSGSINGERGTLIVNECILNFFNERLKASVGALKHAVEGFPEVQFH